MAILVDINQRQCVLAFERFLLYKYPVYLQKWIYTSRHDSTLHNHDFPQIWYCVGGHYLHQVGDDVYECSKGSAVFVPAGVFHKFCVSEGEYTELLSLDAMYDLFLDLPYCRYLNAISALFLYPLAEEVGHTFPAYRILKRESQKVFEECASWLSMLSVTRPGAIDQMDILEKLEELFSLPEFALPDVCKEKAMQAVEGNLIPMMKAIRYLNDHYYEKLVEQMILSSIGISHANFYRSFKCYTGYTFAQYRQILRVKYVHTYLSRTTYPLSYISDVCGFCDTQYMSRIYKKYTNLSPREARMRLYKLHKNEEKINFM